MEKCIKPNAFGNALGSSLAEKSSGFERSTYQHQEMSPIGADELKWGSSTIRDLDIGLPDASLADGSFIGKSGRVLRPSVQVVQGDSVVVNASNGGEAVGYTEVTDRGRLKSTTQMAYDGNGTASSLARMKIDGGIRHFLINGYLDRMDDGSSTFTKAQLPTTLTLDPFSFDAINERAKLARVGGTSLIEKEAIFDFLNRRSADIAAGNFGTLNAMFDSFKAEVGLNDLHNLDKLQSLGRILEPDNAAHYMQSGDRIIGNFMLSTAAGTAGMFTGGWALGAMRTAGFGMISSGAGSGVVADLTSQGVENLGYLASNGKIGRSGIDLNELKWAFVLGGAPGIAVEGYNGVKSTASWLAPKAGQMFENYMYKTGGLSYVVPPGGANSGLSEIASLNANEVRLSQKTVSYNKIDRATGNSYTYDDLVNSMRTNGWKGDPVDVVRMPDGKLTSMDNTRITAAREAGVDVQAQIRNFDEQLSRQMQIDRNWQSYDTWGEALTARIQAQGNKFSNANPYGATQSPRVTGKPK